jgi:hypothetical protein
MRSFEMFPAALGLGRDCFGGQSGEGQWSGWFIVGFEF